MAAEHRRDRAAHLQEAVAAPRPAALADAAALVVGADREVVGLHGGERRERLVEPAEHAFNGGWLRGTELHPESPQARYVRSELTRAIGIRFVAQHGQRRPHAHPLRRPEQPAKPLHHLLRPRIGHAVEVVHVKPDGQRVESPQRQILHVPLNLGDRRVVVVVVKVAREIHASERLARAAGTPPAARAEAVGAKPRVAEKPARTCRHPRRPIACNPHPSGPHILDPIPLAADRRVIGEDQRERGRPAAVDFGGTAVRDPAGDDRFKQLRHLVAVAGDRDGGDGGVGCGCSRRQAAGSHGDGQGDGTAEGNAWN